MESKNRPNEFLAVNKLSKNIRKSPLQQSNFVNSGNSNASTRQQPQSQVYNVSKNDFRCIVQQLTGSSSLEPLPRPSNIPPKPPSMRLQKNRPPPLTPINRPSISPMIPAQAPVPPPSQNLAMAPAQVPYGNNFVRPLNHASNTTNSAWTNPTLSPISAYMQQLQSCINDAGHRPTHDQPHLMTQIPSQAQAQAQQQLQPRVPGQVLAQLPFSGLLPNPPMPALSSRSPALLPSPISPIPLPSPSSFLHLLSPTPRSPYPLLSPGNQFPRPLSPNFSFALTSLPGIFGPGPLSPLSPGIAFPLSPS